MGQNPLTRQRAGVFTLLEILLVLVIISILARKGFTTYFNKPVLDKDTQKVVSEQGINTSSYKSTIDSTREKIQKINKESEERMKELDNLK